MTFGQFLSILGARWKAALLVLAGVIAVGLIISLATPRQYTAHASLVVEIVKPDPISLAISGGMTSPAYMATQVDILRSDRVARRAVKALRLNENQASRDLWMKTTEGRGDFDTWAASVLSKGLVVKPARESNVINVAYEASDAKFSSLAANAFVQAYVDTVLDLRVDPAKQYSTFFDGRSRQLRDQLESAQSKLSTYQRQKGIVASDERVDVENGRLNELSAQIVLMQALSAESGSRQAAARGDGADNMQDVLLNPLVSGLKTTLSQQEARLQELSSRLGDNHPQVIEAKANIASVRTRLQSEISKVTRGVGVTASINRQREVEIRAAYEAQRQKVLRLKDQRDEASVLMREVDNAQKAYESVMTRVNQTALESQLNQTNISVLNSAVEPLGHSSPNLPLNLMLAAFLGAMLAIATALGLEFMSRRIRSVLDVTQGLGVPIIGIMPRPDKRGLFGRAPLPLLARRVLGQLPVPHPRRA